ncbi:MAG: DUF4010 domain-containing protein [Epsilonproteobacteria bacterium]|nr:DUF4010 domain-containing protein [Campylobacterota bacterium]
METLLSQEWVKIVIVILAGFLIGLDIKTHRIKKDSAKEIGSVRTYAFIALLSYVFYRINIYLYLIGYIVISAHFLLFYMEKLKDKKSGILLFLLTSLVYTFGVIIIKFNAWFLIVVFIAIVFISNLNKRLKKFYKIFDETEIETLAKVVLLSGVILPLLPRTNIHSYIPVSFFKVWLAVVIVSMFSYVGYILKRYIFKEKGYWLTGILGGIYSSTATTIVLAKKAKMSKSVDLFVSSIVIATAIMYLRLLGIAYAFNLTIANKLAIPFVLLALITTLISMFFYHRAKRDLNSNLNEEEDQNPLELGTAFLFAFLFIFMASLTHFVLSRYGDLGLNILSFIVGFTDIDPFVLSILSSKFSVTASGATTAILIAAGSNNILKAFYSYVFTKNSIGKISAGVLLFLGALTIGAGFIV